MKKIALLTLAALLVSTGFAWAAGSGMCGGTRVEGAIVAINADARQIVVAGVTIQVTGETVIKMGAKKISFADLKVGMTVAVCGVVDDDVLVASCVNVKYQGK